MNRTDPAPPDALLRAVGLKVTHGRLRVLSALLAAHQPLSHAELEAQFVAIDGSSLDRVTLYRILDSLVERGLALKASDAKGIFRFSTAGARHRHDSHVHFRCTGCGAVFCLETAPPPPPRLPRGFRLAELSYDLRGTCAACSSSARS